MDDEQAATPHRPRVDRPGAGAGRPALARRLGRRGARARRRAGARDRLPRERQAVRLRGRVHGRAGGDRADWLTVPALVFNAVGGGILSTVVVPAVVVGGLLLFRRPWGAVYYVVAAIASATVTRHHQGDRRRVRAPRTSSCSPTSGPSRRATAPTRRSWRPRSASSSCAPGCGSPGAVYTVLMMLSRTYLGAHWISDTIGGVLVGAGVAVIVWAPFANKLYREQRMPHPPMWVRVHSPSEDVQGH